MKIGVEIGGTFTDLVLTDDRGRLRTVKVPTTPAAPAVGALHAVEQAAPELDRVEAIVHGSTIATNGVIERRGARVGLLVTRGFGDLLELQRQARTNVFDLKYEKPHPLVPREDVREIEERIRADGVVLTPPSRDQVQLVVRELIDHGVSSIAVCLLHAYAYPEHERLVRDAIAEIWPELPVTLSHEVAPIYREYERASTAVLSSYVVPIIDEYLRDLENGLRDLRFGGRLLVMQSNGGVLPATLVRRHAVRTLLSGPAGGVTAAVRLASRLGLERAITFDMGGTSTDVCLVRNGRAEITAEAELDHLPIRVPMVDIITVGAGGGSIASIDQAGVLRVGPRSAGAVPGPACYARGGSRPTVTDANVVIGLIRPQHFLGGRMLLDKDAAVRVCAELGRECGMDALGAARAIVRIVNASMEGALRLVSTERGADPRDHWLISYGGAAGQHAAALAAQLDLRGVIIPPHPGLFSAYGLLVADLQRDWAESFIRSLDGLKVQDLELAIQRLRAAAAAELNAARVDTAKMLTSVSLDMRYPGQAFEIGVMLPPREVPDPAQLANLFHVSHRQRYGHAAPTEVPEIVTVRLAATVRQDEPGSPHADNGEVPRAEAGEVDLNGKLGSVPFLDRTSIRISREVDGPAVVEEESSTVWVPPGWRIRCEADLSLRLERARLA
jgi:N-methylhydantoinase A